MYNFVHVCSSTQTRLQVFMNTPDDTGWCVLAEYLGTQSPYPVVTHTHPKVSITCFWEFYSLIQRLVYLLIKEYYLTSC